MGWQLDIFKFAISPEGWEKTKVLSKFKTQDLHAPFGEGNGLITYLPGRVDIYQHYPHLRTLRVFWMCAESAFVENRLGNSQSPSGKKSSEEHAFFLDWWQDRSTEKLLARIIHRGEGV